jgi:hypothetical protein
MSGEYAPFLEDDEHVDHVVKALAGPNRWLGLGLGTVVGLGVSLWLGVIVGVITMYVAFRSLYACRPIVVTDRAVLLMAAGRYTWKPKALIERLPADTPLRPLKGIWLELMLGSRKVFVATRSLATVRKIETERRDGTQP